MNRRNFFSLFQAQVALPPRSSDMKVSSLEVDGADATRFFMKSGAMPANTVSDTSHPPWDGVLFVDAADGRPKMKMRDGTVYAMVKETA